MSRMLRAVVPVLALAIAGCSDPAGPPARPIDQLPRALTDAERAVIGASNEFAFSLMRRLNVEQPDSNLFISPLSVSMALGMTMNGTAGTTQDEMRTMLGHGGLSMPDANASYRSLLDLLRGLDATVDFRIANSIWYDHLFPVESTFIATTRDYFDAEVAASDFDDPATRDVINDWVDGATAGKISEIIDDIPPDAVMYLLNAIYFKGDWTTSFDPKNTKPAPFSGTGGTVPVPLMYTLDSLKYADLNGTLAVELPYGGGAFAMTVVLPPAGTDVNAFVAGMAPDEWDAVHSALTMQEVMLWLPKFKLERDYLLNDALQALGMREAFFGGDFTPMSQSRGHDLRVNEVKHKTFVDVNEIGTEAAAATSVEIIEVCACNPVFRADRPFVFAIRERLSGTILFVGKIARF